MPIGFVLIRIEPGKEEKIAKNLMKEEAIRELHEVYGIYDIIAKVEAPSLGALDKVVEKIRKTKGIQSTCTLIAAKTWV